MISGDLRKKVLKGQQGEITEYHIYRKLASVTPDEKNRVLLESIADDEKRHYDYWKRFTGEDVEPLRIKIFFYYFLARILGLSFSLKLMERGEDAAQTSYGELKSLDREVEKELRRMYGDAYAEKVKNEELAEMRVRLTEDGELTESFVEEQHRHRRKNR